MNDVNRPTPSQPDDTPSSEQPIAPPPQEQEALYKRDPKETDVSSSGAVSPELELPETQRPVQPPSPSANVSSERANQPPAADKSNTPDVAKPPSPDESAETATGSKGFATFQGNNQKPPPEKPRETSTTPPTETPVSRLWTLLRLPSLLFLGLLLFTYFFYIPALASLFWFALLSLFFIFLALVGMGILQGRYREALWQPIFVLVLLVVLGAGYLFGLYWTLYRNTDASLEANRTDNNFVQLDSPLTFRFEKPMSTRYLDEPVAFAPEIAGNWEINQTLGFLPYTYEATFVPAENLRPGQIYTVDIERLRDGFGRSIESDSLTFQTAGISDIIESDPPTPDEDEAESPDPDDEEPESDDTTNLRIVGSDPQANARLVGLTRPLQIRFDQAINAESLSFVVSPSHELTARWNGDNTVLTLTPDKRWQPDSRYSLRIEEELTVADGEITLEEDWSLTFRTAPAFGLTRSVPQNEANAVPADTLVRLTFSNPLLVDQKLDEVILVEPKITVERTLQENTIILRPQPGWEEKTTYRITIASGLTDLYGTPWAEERIVTFNTVDTEEPESPPEEDEEEPDEQEPPATEQPSKGKPDKEEAEPEAETPDEPQPEPEDSQTTWPEGIASQEEEKQAITTALNQFREERGILPTTELPELTKLAENYCIDFAQNGYLGGNHRDSQGRTTEDRLREAGVEYHNYVEALYADGIWSADQTVNSWVNSSSYLRRDSFNQTGLCVAKRQDGVTFAVLLVVEPMAK